LMVQMATALLLTIQRHLAAVVHVAVDATNFFLF
jgi:hypothetical protein